MQPKIFTLWPVKENRSFPGSPVVKTLDVGGMSSILGWDPKILHAMWLGQKIEKKKNKKWQPLCYALKCVITGLC